jgi:methylmalonyl-CoA mutase N-terminal domain/subunit
MVSVRGKKMAADESRKKPEKKGKGSEDMTGPKETNTGVKVKLFYGSTDVPEFNYETSLGNPGSYPYTRGIYPSMYRGRLWTMRQYAGFSTSENTNSRFKFLLNQGQTGLSLALTCYNWDSTQTTTARTMWVNSALRLIP